MHPYACGARMHVTGTRNFFLHRRPVTRRDGADDACAHVHYAAMHGRAEAILGAFERYAGVAKRTPRGWWRWARHSESRW